MTEKLALVMIATRLAILLGIISVVFSSPNKLYEPVGSKDNPGKSCQDILHRGGKGTGNYHITLGQKTLQVYCDQITAGGGWTLVHSMTFIDPHHPYRGTNAITPRPTWPLRGDVRTSTTPPLSESELNAMDFRLWKKIGKEFMIKSNINNWIVCSDRRGSLVHWRSGSIDCDIVNNIMLQCENIVPNMIEVDFYNSGPNLYDDSTDSATIDTYYFFDTLTYNVESPQWEPCGMLTLLRPVVKIPRANIYIR